MTTRPLAPDSHTLPGLLDFEPAQRDATQPDVTPSVEATSRVLVENSRRASWWLIAAGMVSGSALGLWSFGGPIPAPPGFESYADLPRRLLRLAHIALVALPIINLEYLRHSIDIAPRTRQRGCRLMMFGMLSLPALLALTAVVPVLLYALPLPVVALTCAVLLLAVNLGRSTLRGGS